MVESSVMRLLAAAVVALTTAAPLRAEEVVLPLPDLYQSIRPSVVRVIVRGGAGSGFGTLTRISAITDLMAQEAPRSPRPPVRPSLGLHLRLAGLPFGPEDRRNYGGLGGDIQVVLLHRLAISVRGHYDWLVSGTERAAGRPGRLRELLFQVGPSFPTPFDPRGSGYLEIHPYGFGGAVSVGVGEVHETLQLVDPACDPAQDPCAYLQGEDARWENSIFPVFGGGIRVTLFTVMVGIEVGIAPDAPSETFHVIGYVGTRLGKP